MIFPTEERAVSMVDSALSHAMQPAVRAPSREATGADAMPHFAASRCPSQPSAPTVGLDALDRLSLLAVPDELWAEAHAHSHATATDLAHEGGRGATARRLLARDVVMARVRLRVLQGQHSTLIERATTDPAALRAAVELDRLVESEHGRMLRALELLQRCDATPAAAVAVTARQAIVSVTNK